MDQSQYIVYVDESGDHGLENPNPQFPVFVLAFCIFKKETYISECVPALQRLKFEFFGHDMVVLHERDIRKAHDPFKFLVNREIRERFLSRIGEVLADADFTIIAAAIRKTELSNRYLLPESPYHIALGFCMERLLYFAREARESHRIVHVVFESRGAREDSELELEFRRVAAGASLAGEQMPFEPIFASKKANCCGLQIADLVARPIGLHVLRPGQGNRAFDVVKKKLRTGKEGEVRGYGLKVFP